MLRKLAIVPAYNEEGAVGQTVREIRDQTDFDVLVIDDGSTDDTASVARVAGAQTLRLPFNLGIGGAVQTGYQFALHHGYDLAIQVDGDGQHDPREIPALVERLQTDPDGLNMITGSRFLVVGDGGYRSSRPRRLGIRIFARILSWVVGRRVTDPTSGFRLVDRLGIELFARDYPHDYPEVEAVLLLHFHRLRSAEHPVTMRARRAGVSSIDAGQSVYYMVKVTLAIFVGLVRARPNVEPGDPAPVTAEHSI